MAKSRRAAASASKAGSTDTIGALAKAATHADIAGAFVDDLGARMTDDRREMSQTFQSFCDMHGERGKKTVSYTQGMHWGLLDVLALQETKLDAAMNALIVAARAIEKLERELKSSKALRTKAFDALHVEQINDRRIRLALGSGEDEASFELAFPMLIDRGAWSERAAYDRGDAVTASGGFWVAQVDNPLGRPGVGDSGWRLVVKSPRGAEQRK